MAGFTLTIGVVLIVLGVGSYLGTGRESATALIPSAIGLVLAILGGIARNPDRSKPAMHIAVGVAMVAFLGTIRGVPPFLRLMAGEEVDRPVAAVFQVITAVLTLLIVAGGVRSFVRARRAKT
ncbi:MAG: hypothetical protein GF346_00210 [Candidatus Eisenbacteria bacterium]|nr:hypothetical protein [Candidatus Latescibacterota bacterium]MBD3300855.1 hypothetical protein [Candidatus Eisenbacteria bacterium]